ncbi:hypothetical protein Q1695_004077 [Nippostrongylus brasiliensis]|nr:hypothetical protein Q1695_004077 [Nippostrongylus brasiliensis]
MSLAKMEQRQFSGDNTKRYDTKEKEIIVRVRIFFEELRRQLGPRARGTIFNSPLRLTAVACGITKDSAIRVSSHFDLLKGNQLKAGKTDKNGPEEAEAPAVLKKYMRQWGELCAMASTSKERESYGRASYAISRHRKNRVFMWQSQVVHGRVYEFVVASKMKIPGYVSWKCMHCMQLRERLKKEKKCVKDLKIPLVLIDNDIIRENPDKPLNAPHFCKGKDVVDAVLKRTKLEFYQDYSNDVIEVPKDQFSDAVLDAVPLQLDDAQKRQVKQSIDEKCERVMKRVLRKRKREASQGYASNDRVINVEIHPDDQDGLPRVVVSSAMSPLDENEYVDVEAEPHPDMRNSAKNEALY